MINQRNLYNEVRIPGELVGCANPTHIAARKNLCEGKDYRSNFDLLPEDVRGDVIAAEKRAALEAGVNNMGLERVCRRVPVILYYATENPELGYGSVAKHIAEAFAQHEIAERAKYLEDQQYEIGLCPAVVKTHSWGHDMFGDVVMGVNSWEKGTSSVSKYCKQTDDSIASFIKEHIGENIRPAFNGIIYQGFDAGGQERLFLVLDTSAEAGIVNANVNIAERLAQTAQKYGVHGLFTLYATEHLTNDRAIGYEARLDPSDAKYTNLQITDLSAGLQKIKEQWEQETFWRMLVQSYVQRGKLTNSDPDPEQSMRDLLRDNMLMRAEKRAMEDYGRTK